MSSLRPDTQNFNRLLVSLGLVAIVLAVTVPWLLYRDTGVLTISRGEMSTLTASARDSLSQRQHTIQAIQTGLPWFSGTLVLIGLGLLIWGAIRMKEAQGWEDREQQARTKQHEASIESQTQQERQKHLDEEATEQLLAEAQAAAEQHQPPKAVALRPEVEDKLQRPREASVNMMRRIEDAVLARISELLPNGYRLKVQVKVQSPLELGVFLDGLIEAPNPDEPDVIVEIKMRANPSHSASRMAADQLLAAMSRYEAVTGKRCVGWLIVVFTGDRQAWSRFRSITKDDLSRLLPSGARATLVIDSELDSLVLPIIGPTGSTRVID
jgi:hypothetical protein